MKTQSYTLKLLKIHTYLRNNTNILFPLPNENEVEPNK